MLLLLGNAFLLQGAMHVRAQEAVQWYEPSQISRDAHESMAVAVVVREGQDGAPEIWTRRRPAHADGRNRMYAGRWEALGKPLQHGESPLRALQQPFRDIFDMSDSNDFQNVRVMGTLPEDVDVVVATTSDKYACIDPNLSQAERTKCQNEQKKFVPCALECPDPPQLRINEKRVHASVHAHDHRVTRITSVRMHCFMLTCAVCLA